MKREDVYKLIDGEREYQNSIWVVKASRDADGVGNHLTVMATYLRRAQEAYADREFNKEAMSAIRCIVAQGVWCMERNEAPPRREAMAK